MWFKNNTLLGWFQSEILSGMVSRVQRGLIQLWILWGTFRGQFLQNWGLMGYLFREPPRVALGSIFQREGFRAILYIMILTLRDDNSTDSFWLCCIFYMSSAICVCVYIYIYMYKSAFINNYGIYSCHDCRYVYWLLLGRCDIGLLFTVCYMCLCIYFIGILECLCLCSCAKQSTS